MTMDELDTYHKQYITKMQQDDEFTVEEWAARNWAGDVTRATKELKFFEQEGIVVSRKGVSSTSCHACRLYKLKPPPE